MVVVRARGRLPFSAVNRPGSPDYDAGVQRHHILPRQLLARRSFERMFTVLGHANTGFDDFRRNGLLLPSAERTAIRLGLPMHRGPHKAYSAMVTERVGQIESQWAKRSRHDPSMALCEALMRLALLQKALRRRLLEGQRKPLRLNRFDPLGQGRDFSQLDAMAEMLWGSTEPVMEPFA